MPLRKKKCRVQRHARRRRPRTKRTPAKKVSHHRSKVKVVTRHAARHARKRARATAKRTC